MSAPIAAKAVEDTAFYRYGRLLSRNDVGFDVTRFSDSAEDFHANMRRRRDIFLPCVFSCSGGFRTVSSDERDRLGHFQNAPYLDQGAFQVFFGRRCAEAQADSQVFGRHAL